MLNWKTIMYFAVYSDPVKIAVLSSILTVIGGVLIVSFTEILKSIYLEPIRILNEHLGTIIDRIIFYAANLTNYNDDTEFITEMHSHLRSASSQLRAKSQALKLYKFWALLRLVPSQDSIDIVTRELIGLSNGIPTQSLSRNSDIDFISRNHESMEKIATELKFKLN